MRRPASLFRADFRAARRCESRADERPEDSPFALAARDEHPPRHFVARDTPRETIVISARNERHKYRRFTPPRHDLSGIYPRRCFIRVNVAACHYFSRTRIIIIIAFVLHHSLAMKRGLLRIFRLLISDNRTSVSLVALRTIRRKDFGKLQPSE